MTWSISASGKKAAVVEMVKAQNREGLAPKEDIAFRQAKNHVLSVLEETPPLTRCP